MKLHFAALFVLLLIFILSILSRFSIRLAAVPFVSIGNYVLIISPVSEKSKRLFDKIFSCPRPFSLLQ